MISAQEYKEASERYKEAVEAELERLFEAEGADIYPKLKEAMFYSLEAGGKRLRPVLLLSVCEMLGGDPEKALPFACALEMIHTYSLIHDDLPCMDDDDMRRGRPSNHKMFGEAMALLAGDGLLSFAFEVMLGALRKDPDEGCLKAAYEIALRAGSRGVVTGQAADKEHEGAEDESLETLEYIHEHKTADMLCAAVIAGAYIAGADEETVAKLSEYSKNMGLLFQITDDMLDIKGDPELMGKTLGKDAVSGKLTYASFFGYEGAKKAAQAAAGKALDAVESIESSDFLRATVLNMLVRSR